MAVDGNQYYEQMITQMDLVQASITTVGTPLQETSPVVLETVYTAVQSATVPFDQAIAAFDADIDTTTFAGVQPGVPGPINAVALLEQSADVEQLALLIVGRAYVTRVGVNINNAPG